MLAYRLKDLRYALFLLLDALFLRSYRIGKRDVVQIRLDAIGDFILWLDSARALRGLYPGHEITLIANSAWAELARCLPYWDEVLTVDVPKLMRDPLYRWRLMRNIRQRGFDIAIQPTFSRLFLTGDSLMRATGARERIGSVGDCTNIQPRWKQISDHWYTRLIPAAPASLMELERNTEFVRHLGATGYNAAVHLLPPVAMLPQALYINEAYFIVFPGASSKAKQWPLEKFVAVISKLHLTTGWSAVLAGSRSEHSLCAAIAKQTFPTTLNLAGKASLPEFAELVRRASLLIGNDTSAVHIAAAVGTPSVCIVGGGHFGRFMPYPEGLSGRLPVAVYEQMECFGCNWRCSQPHSLGGPTPCISSISVDSVVSATRRALEKKAGKSV